VQLNISRYRNVEEVKYECEVVTPMFVAGADQNKAVLRAPTVKGLLRYWWRATNEFDSLRDLKKREGEIFGTTESKSKVSLHIDMDTVKNGHSLPRGSFSRKPDKFQGDILKYLAYGTSQREYISPENLFRITIRFPKEYKQDIQSAMYGLSVFGGIGAKSRNGFGSFRLVNTRIDQPEVVRTKMLSVAEYTKVNKGRRLFKTRDVFDGWEEALSCIGYVYWQARMAVDDRHEFDGRAQIALPITARNEPIPDKYKKQRQAKPFFLHVSRMKSGEHKDKYRGMISFFPLTYMLKNDGTYNKVFEKAIKAIERTGEMK